MGDATATQQHLFPSTRHRPARAKRSEKGWWQECAEEGYNAAGKPCFKLHSAPAFLYFSLFCFFSSFLCLSGQGGGAFVAWQSNYPSPGAHSKLKIFPDGTNYLEG